MKQLLTVLATLSLLSPPALAVQEESITLASVTHSDTNSSTLTSASQWQWQNQGQGQQQWQEPYPWEYDEAHHTYRHAETVASRTSGWAIIGFGVLALSITWIVKLRRK